MARSTQYLVAMKDKQSDGSTCTSYLGWIGSGDCPAWGWAIGGRKGAKRFDTKAEALNAANRWENTIRSKGYTPGRIAVSPARGGAECRRVSTRLN